MAWIREGDELEPLGKVATTQTLVKFAGASGDFSPHHYDQELGEMWFPGTGIILHGALKAAWLGQYVTGWIGDEGRLRHLKTEDRGMDIPRHMISHSESAPGDTWECRGKVVRKYVNRDAGLVDLKIWVQNGGGKITTPGEATVSLPRRER